MKTRITALLLMMAMLLTLLSGCGTAEAEPETTMAPETEAPTTEPATEPTTEPTEPPTALEQFGVELWEGASNVVTYGAPNMDGDDLPISRGLGGKSQNYKTYFYIKEDAGRLLEDLVAAPVDIQIYEFPSSSFNDDIDWMKEKLKPFYQYCKKQDSGDYSFKEWVNANQDKKLLWMTSIVAVDGTELCLKGIEENFGSCTYGANVWSPQLANPVTGERFNGVGGNYDAMNNPVVGYWMLDQDIEILALYTAKLSGWFGDYRMQNNAIYDMYALLPAEFEDICFVMSEYASVESYEEPDEPETDALWETGNILEDYDTEKYNYYFYSLYSKPE